MNISGYNFRRVAGTSYYSGPGVFLYLHQETGKYFVQTFRNSQRQKSKKNYPKHLKELLKTNASEVVLFFAELEKNTKEALHHTSCHLIGKLSEMGKLYERAKPNRGNLFVELGLIPPQFYTVWSMVHKSTGAVFYFEELEGVCVVERVEQRIKTFNNYAAKCISNANRVMYQFTKQHYPLHVNDWVVRDLATHSESERKVLQIITKLSKTHLEQGEVVLNRICNNDSLYYRNALLKLPHVSIEEYLTFKPE